MIAPRELATQLAGSIFDHVERERTLVRHNIEDVLHDGLLLGLAKQASGPQPPQTGVGADTQEINDAAKVLCKSVMNNTRALHAMPREICLNIESLYFALVRAGWKP